jgi:hypothetical protein
MWFHAFRTIPAMAIHAPRFDAETWERCLARAQKVGDATAAAEFGCSPVTVRTKRHRVRKRAGRVVKAVGRAPGERIESPAELHRLSDPELDEKVREAWGLIDLIAAQMKATAGSQRSIQSQSTAYGTLIDKALLLERLDVERQERNVAIETKRAELLVQLFTIAIDVLDAPDVVLGGLRLIIARLLRQLNANEDMIVDPKVARDVNTALRAHFKAAIRAEIVLELAVEREAEEALRAAREAAAPPEAEIVEDEEPEELAEVLAMPGVLPAAPDGFAWVPKPGRSAPFVPPSTGSSTSEFS